MNEETVEVGDRFSWHGVVYTVKDITGDGARLAGEGRWDGSRFPCNYLLAESAGWTRLARVKVAS